MAAGMCTVARAGSGSLGLAPEQTANQRSTQTGGSLLPTDHVENHCGPAGKVGVDLEFTPVSKTPPR